MKGNKFAKAFFLCLLYLVSIHDIHSQIILDQNTQNLYPGERMEIYEDKEGILTIDDIIQKQFKNSPSLKPNFGFTTSAIWVRLRFQNNSSYENWFVYIEEPLLHHVDFFIQRNENWTSQKSGRMVPVSKRPVPLGGIIFPLNLSEGETTIYLRFTSRDSLFIPIEIVRSGVFEWDEVKRGIRRGAYTGAIAILLLYNLFVFFSLRDLAYLHYFFYGLAVLGLQFTINGMIFRYFDFLNEWIRWRLPMFFIIALATSGSLFCIRFLVLDKYAPKVKKSLLLIVGLVQIMFLVSFTETGMIWSTRFINIFIIIFPILIFKSVISSLRSGYRPAFYFGIAWGYLIISLLIGALLNLGLIPHNFFTEHAPRSGFLGELLLLSFALGNRYALIQQEKQSLEIESVKQKKESELLKLQNEIAEMQRLKEVISPHFLLNTLNSLMPDFEKNPELATDLIMNLADQFRSVVKYAKEGLVSAHREIQICRQHIHLMSVRFNKKYLLEVEEIPESDELPPLVLHSILENAISHEPELSSGLQFHISRSILKLPNSELGNQIQTNWLQYGIQILGEYNADKSVGSGTGMKYIHSQLKFNFGDDFKIEEKFSENLYIITLSWKLQNG